MSSRRPKPQPSQFYTQQNIPYFREFASKIEGDTSLEGKKEIMQKSNIQSQKSIDFDKKIDELIYENQMKKKALEKASKMIELIDQQRKILMQQLQRVHYQLGQKQQTIISLKQNIKKLETKNQQLIEEINKKNQSATKQIITSNSLFFSFTQPKTLKSTSSKGFSPSTLSIRNGLTISQQFSPWLVQSELIQSLAEAMSHEQNENFQLYEMKSLCKNEQQEIQQQRSKLMSKQQQIYEELLIQNEEEQDYSIRLSQAKFTTQISQSRVQSIKQILSQYQKIITDFRHYSSLLKAYLCQTINVINKISHMFNQPSENYKQPLNFIYDTVKQFIQNESYNSKPYLTENQQLRYIINEMIHNFSLIKKQQTQKQMR